MKFIFFTILTALIVAVFNPFLPYWGVMILIALLAAILRQRGAGAFFAGGVGMSLAWLGQSIYISTVSGSSLTYQMGELMGFENEIVLFAITGIVGFLLGAFSALCGSLFRKLLKRKPDNIYRSY
ncbi:hypothetical protein [Algoriphagus persicinus]|uniref:hypothetical protein n=1 Tax=Algoriphagus persicinus TaxID=3108754 RepID=UPI002B3ED387|nr:MULTISPECIES: hypothetical protein [unclassified Algoriphagus]MEB2779641.1 hypothetical protein [Algoriphagus sp. C2-6-M1]MEB2785166.1 hypothetical protein [Algoriphagus sp. E1-3-M2]